MKLEDIYDAKYTVESPVPFLWPYHTKKTFNGEPDKSTRRSYRKCDFQYLHVDDEYDDYREEENMDYPNFEEEWIESDSSDLHNKNQIFFLDWCIKGKEKPQQRLKQRKRNSDIIQGTFQKNKIYVIEDPQKYLKYLNHKIDKEALELGKEHAKINFEEVISESSTNNKKDIQEFTDFFNPVELIEENLQAVYGNSYLESNLYPRSFAIVNYKQSALSVAVNVHDVVVDDLQKVSLKIFSLDPIDLADALLHRGSLRALIEMLYQMKQSKLSVKHKVNKGEIDCNFVSKTLKPLASIKTVHEIVQPVLLESKFNSKNLNNSHLYEINYEDILQYNTVCSICFSNIVSTRLQSCKHLFCNDCLNHYVESHILYKSSEITCPELRCSCKLNLASVMKYLDSNALFTLYFNKLVQSIVLRDENIKQCPTPSCSHIAVRNIIKLPKTNRINIPSVVSCVCNKTWCFGCQKEDHWPASCELFEKYQQQYKNDVGTLFDQYGNIYRTSIEYRKCPFCTSPVIKNGGCNHISCVCGKHFCWRCLKPLNEEHVECSAVGNDVRVFTSLDLVNPSTSWNVQVFRSAMKYKAMRKELSLLSTKLKLKRGAPYLLDPNSLRSIVSECLTLIEECYKIIEYSTLYGVNKKFKHIRYKNYVNLVGLYTSMLYDEINYKNLSEINKNRLTERKEWLQNVIKKMFQL